ncbi:MAG: group II intron reverse transcriptase/maturase [Rhizomicrobium sp.]
MKRGVEKSDASIVPVKRANKAEQSVAERVEGSDAKKRNADLQSTDRTQSRAAVSQAQGRIREAITRNKQEKLTALLHHMTTDGLRVAFFSLKRDAAPGVDHVTWNEYADGLEERLSDLHGCVHRGAYWALPSRRKFIPKPDGRLRPLGIAALEDKIVQAALVAILTPVYEAEFLEFSYGFRPGRSQHDALDALAFGITRRKVRWVLDADIQSFFDRISHEWLIKFVEHRIGDRRVIRLIQKWLKAGVIEDGIEIATMQGTPQGAVISPLLANIYLHYVYDLWTQQWRKRHSSGDMIVVRYADDTIVGFEHRDDAERFLKDLHDRLAQFGLNLHPEKTRLIEFGKNAIDDRSRRGEGKPETFDFLGFTHYCAKARSHSGFKLGRKTQAKRKRARLKAIKDALRRNMHKTIDEQGRWLAAVLRGYFAYFAVPDNSPSLSAFRQQVKERWLRVLRRRSQRSTLTYERMQAIVDRYLPVPHVLHPWPEQRFRVTHST